MSENKLTAPERSDFRRLCKEVDDGLNMHKAGGLKMAVALKEIRDRELYKEQWKTFEAFVDDRFGFTRQRAYQLIEAVETREKITHASEEMSTIVDKFNEAHLRELAKVPEKAIQTVLDRVVEHSQETGNPITAKSIKEAAERLADDRPVESRPVEKSKSERADAEQLRAKKTVEALMRTVDDLQALRKSGNCKPILEKCRELLVLISGW